MGTMIVRKKDRVLLLCVLLLLGGVLTPVAMAVDVCGVNGAAIFSEPEPVDIDCETGQTLVYDSTVNLLPGAHISEDVAGTGGAFLVGFGESVINIYGGVIDNMLNFVSTDTVTVYASSVDLIPGILEEGETQIVNPGAGVLVFDLTGTYEDGTDFSIPCYLEAYATLGLNVPQTAPEIDVLPAMLSWDLGDVEVGQSSSVLVQIFNIGTADLTVSSVTLTGDAGFDLTAGPATPLVIAPNMSVGVDYEVTFAPTAEGLVSAVVQVVSDDEDEPSITVTLSGVGIIAEVPPTQQIQDILDYFDASVAEGTLQGYGPGNSPSKRLRALRNMIESASDLINAGIYDQAIDQLESIAKKTDGVSKPQDFVTGEAVSGLNAKIEALIADLTS